MAALKVRWSARATSELNRCVLCEIRERETKSSVQESPQSYRLNIFGKVLNPECAMKHIREDGEMYHFIGCYL